MLENILRQGFADAHRRFGLVFLDLIWKAVWLIATSLALLLVFLWFGGQLQSLAWQDTGVASTNVWIAITLLREFWTAHQVAIFTAVLAVLLISAFAWLWLEALFHSRMTERRNTKVFFLSGTARTAVLAATAAITSLVVIAGAPVIAVVIFAAVAFAVTVFETMIRTDAVELLGADLIRTTGLIGILVAVEAIIAVSSVIVLVAGFLTAARLSDLLVMLGAAAVLVVILSLLHSYFLLVRFSAIGVMRSGSLATRSNLPEQEARKSEILGSAI